MSEKINFFGGGEGLDVHAIHDHDVIIHESGRKLEKFYR